MKVEIKKISIMTVLFSVFPLAVFAVMLVEAFVELFNPQIAFSVNYLMELIMQAILRTFLFLVYTVFFVGAYNVLRLLGIRGLHITLEDKE